jgi:hypothetical protein
LELDTAKTDLIKGLKQGAAVLREEEEYDDVLRSESMNNLRQVQLMPIEGQYCRTYRVSKS